MLLLVQLQLLLLHLVLLLQLVLLHLVLLHLLLLQVLLLQVLLLQQLLLQVLLLLLLLLLASRLHAHAAARVSAAARPLGSCIDRHDGHVLLLGCQKVCAAAQLCVHASAHARAAAAAARAAAHLPRAQAPHWRGLGRQEKGARRRQEEAWVGRVRVGLVGAVQRNLLGHPIHQGLGVVGRLQGGLQGVAHGLLLRVLSRVHGLPIYVHHRGAGVHNVPSHHPLSIWRVE